MKKYLSLIAFLLMGIMTISLSSCSSDDDGEGGASGFTINGKSYSPDDTPSVKYHAATSGNVAYYDYGTVLVMNNADGYHIEWGISLFNNAQLKDGTVLGNGSEGAVFELEHLYSFTNLTGRLHGTEYISGNVIVDKVSSTSITLNFNKYKVHLDDSCDEGDYVLNGKLTFSVK